MTYVELIVVLSIFSIVTATVIFNYKDFQRKVDLKNLANDIALKVVEAQKNSTGGKLPFGKTIISSPPLAEPWKPSYGIHFDPSPSANTGPEIFYYFTDLNQDNKYDGLFNCPLGECIEKFQITNGYKVKFAKIYFYNGNVEDVTSNISLTFTRPDSVMSLESASSSDPLPGVDYVEFVIGSDDSELETSVKVYASGRIEIL